MPRSIFRIWISQVAEIHVDQGSRFVQPIEVFKVYHWKKLKCKYGTIGAANLPVWLISRHSVWCHRTFRNNEDSLSNSNQWKLFSIIHTKPYTLSIQMK